MSPSPTYLIVGATGKQGSSTISTLLSLSTPPSSIRFITRSPSSASAQKLTSKGLTAIKADLADKASLVSALKGVDRAFLMTYQLGGADKEEIQGKTFVDAAKEVGLGHLVFTSVGAAEKAVKVPHFVSKFNVSRI